MAILAALVAFAAPLSDPDLPEHLSVGAWIVRHGHLPTLEPFAWTRAGQPYYAYSWLTEVAYYEVLRLVGPVGLHLLQALVGAAAVLAAAALARARRWGPGVAAALGALNFAAMGSVANELRPQQLLFVLVPLAWALADAAVRAPGDAARSGSPGPDALSSWSGDALGDAARAGLPGSDALSAGPGEPPATVGRARRTASLLLGHLAVGCLAANTHLFFPLTAAPIAIRGAGGSPRTARRLILPAIFLVAGWLLSPYGHAWSDVFRLNLGPNVLLQRPPAIGELEPGFEAMMEVAGALVLVVLLLALPWWRPAASSSATGGAPAPAAARARIVEALVWAGGLVGFAFAFRLLAVWWLTLLPFAGERLSAAAAVLARRPWTRRAAVTAVAVLALLTGMPPWPRELRLEGGVRAHTLPTPAAAAALPLAHWLACHTDARAQGRIFTTFNYGSYLTWRLPGYSVSIDGRTIFPDSVAREFAWTLAGFRRTRARTWQSADLALLPPWLADGDAIAADPAWVRLTSNAAHGGAMLWARRAWWARWRRPPATSSGGAPSVPGGC